MANPLVAVTDHVFPNLEPTKRVLSKLHAELKLAQATTPEAILDVAREADGVIVCYAKMPASVIEQLKKYAKDDNIKAIVNVAVNQTLNRTIITGGTALLSVIALYFFGGEVLRGFAFTMIVGILTGTYSSVFIAAAIVTFWPHGRGGGVRCPGGRGRREFGRSL